MGDGPFPLRYRIQRALAAVLKRWGFDIWYDVATFSPSASHVCCNCGRRSFTERGHLTHEPCDRPGWPA